MPRLKPSQVLPIFSLPPKRVTPAGSRSGIAHVTGGNSLLRSSLPVNVTGRAEASRELSTYNFCVGAVIIEPFRIVAGAGLGALFGFMAAVENDEAVSVHERADFPLSRGISTGPVDDLKRPHAHRAPYGP